MNIKPFLLNISGQKFKMFHLLLISWMVKRGWKKAKATTPNSCAFFLKKDAWKKALRVIRLPKSENYIIDDVPTMSFFTIARSKTHESKSLKFNTQSSANTTILSTMLSYRLQ